MSTSFLPLKLQTIKLLHRRDLTPTKLHHIYKFTDAMCWKGCNLKSKYIHCWWQCPQIQKFWTMISAAIFTITSIRLQEGPEIMLLNKWDNNIPWTLDKTISTLLTLAKVEIASQWKDSKGLLIVGWHDQLWNCFLKAKITDKVLKVTNNKYKSHLEDTWSPVLQCLEDLKLILSNAVSQFFPWIYSRGIGRGKDRVIEAVLHDVKLLVDTQLYKALV